MPARQVLTLARPGPPVINGHAITTCTHYSLGTCVIEGKLTAMGRMAFVVPRDHVEVDIAKLCKQPFSLVARAGRIAYALDECRATPIVRCESVRITESGIDADVINGVIELSFSFSSENVSLLESNP